MLYKARVIDLIKKRISVRTYLSSPISSEQESDLKEFIASAEAPPFGTKIRFILLTASPDDYDSLQKMITYGMVKYPAGFIVGAAERSNRLHEDFGYLMEKIVLFATDLDLGTCWLGGTFRKSRFAEAIETEESETVPAVVAIGIPASQPRIRDKMIVRMIKAKKRLSHQRLFFKDSFDTPLNLEYAGKYREPLEMVRLAPSASNKQPWRVIYTGNDNNYHFYLQRDKSYDPQRKKPINMADLQRIDMGIAMCHFELTAKELNLKGTWKDVKPSNLSPQELTEYISSWKVE